MDHHYHHHGAAAHSRRGLWGKFQKVLKLSRSFDEPSHPLRVASPSVPEKISKFLQTPPQKHERGNVKLHHAAGSQLGFWSVPTARKQVALTSSVSERELVASTALSTPTALAAHSSFTPAAKAPSSSKTGGATAQRYPLRQQKSEDSSLLYDSSHFATISKPQGSNGLQHRSAALSQDQWHRGRGEQAQRPAAGSSLAVGHSWASVRTLSFGDDGTVQALHAGASSRPWTPEVNRRWAGSGTADTGDALTTPEADDVGDSDNHVSHQHHLHFLHHQPHLHHQRLQQQGDNKAMYRYNSEPRFNDCNVLKPLQKSPSRISCRTVHNDEFATSTTPRQRSQTAWSLSNTLPIPTLFGSNVTSATLAHNQQHDTQYTHKQQKLQQSRSMHLMHVDGTLINFHHSVDHDDNDGNFSGSETSDNDSKGDRTDSETEQNFQMVCDTLQLCFDSCDNILNSQHRVYNAVDTAPSTSTDIN
jgi:hypothetical protein